MNRVAAALLFLIAVTATADEPCAVYPDEAFSPTAITEELAATFVPQRMLVMKAFWRSGTEALLVEDPREVRAMFALLTGNDDLAHSCGYHWAIVFEDASRRIVQHFHNEHCQPYRRFDEEIQTLLRTYFARVNAAPASFLIEVELDPRAEPEAIARALERDGRRVFFLQHPDGRLPRLKIKKTARGLEPRKVDEKVWAAVEAKARENTLAAIEPFLAHGAHVFEAPHSVGSSSGGGVYESQVEATIVFPLAFDESRLRLEDGEFERPKSWIATVVSPVRFSKELDQTLRNASPFVLGAAAVEERSVE